MMLAGIAGVVLVAAEGLGSVAAMMNVLRLAVYGAAFCAFVALLQWLFTIDLSGIIRQSLPGFTRRRVGFNVYEARGALQRVVRHRDAPDRAGRRRRDDAAHRDRRRAARRGRQRAAPMAAGRADRDGGPGVGVPIGVLAALISPIVLMLSLPARQRVTALLVLPVGAFTLGIARPGYLRTLAEFVGRRKRRHVRFDPPRRLAARRQDGQAHPWFGRGPGPTSRTT